MPSAKKIMAGIFDEPESEAAPQAQAPAHKVIGASVRGEGRDSHPGKKPVLIHIPEDMHRVLRQLSVEEGGEPITRIVERGLREYLVTRGHTRFKS